MFECKLCMKKIQDGGLEGHHFSKHKTIPFDIKNFQEIKTEQCVVQNESVKESTNEKPAWTVLNPFNCQSCGVRSLRQCKNVRFNSLNHTDPSGMVNICETCTEEQLKIQALEKKLSEMKALQEKRLETKRLEEKRLKEKRLKEKLKKEKQLRMEQLKMKPLQEQPLEKKHSLNLAIVNKDIIKFYRCKVCHRSGITRDQLYKHPSWYHGSLCKTPQNAFELTEVKVCGKCSDCGQPVNEKRFAEHLQQAHRQALIPTKSDKSKVKDMPSNFLFLVAFNQC